MRRSCMNYRKDTQGMRWMLISVPCKGNHWKPCSKDHRDSLGSCGECLCICTSWSSCHAVCNVNQEGTGEGTCWN